MKKIVWIYSINVDGVAPFGYGANLTMIKPRKFQEKLANELLPEFDVHFISYNTLSHDIPLADIIVFNDKDAKYLPEAIKEIGCCLLFEDIYKKNFTKIKEALKNHLAN